MRCTMYLLAYQSATNRSWIEAESKQQISKLKQTFEILAFSFELRRIGVFAQFYQGQVVLWMVVAITVSGVILAGIQLLIGFSFARKSALREGVKSNESRAADKLNASDPDGVSKIEYGKGGLIVQSSVTGLLILIVSFAFFYVFVTKIYSISENT